MLRNLFLFLFSFVYYYLYIYIFFFFFFFLSKVTKVTKVTRETHPTFSNLSCGGQPPRSTPSSPYVYLRAKLQVTLVTLVTLLHSPHGCCIPFVTLLKTPR